MHIKVTQGWFQTMVLTTIALSAFFLPTMAQSAEERVTLLLNGRSCSRWGTEIEIALRRITEVRSVDLRSVPGHALVDVEAERMNAGELAAVVNQVPGIASQCAAEVMKSCISAGSIQSGR